MAIFRRRNLTNSRFLGIGNTSSNVQRTPTIACINVDVCSYPELEDI